MAKIVDLSVLVKEPTIVKISEGEQFEIPGNVSTSFTMELMAYYSKVQNVEMDINKAENVDEIVDKSEELMGMLKDLALKILQQDKSKDIDMDYIEEHLDNVDMLRGVIEIGMGHIEDIEKDPN